MRKIFLTVLLVAFASAAFAEGTPKKPSVAGFVSNGFWSMDFSYHLQFLTSSCNV